MIENENPTPYEMAADDLIAVLYKDADRHSRARFEMNLRPAYMPTDAHRAVYEAINQLRDENKTVHDTTILAITNGRCDVHWLAKRVVLYDKTRLAAFDDNVQMVIEQGLVAGTRRMLQIADEQLKQGKSRNETTNNLMHLLATVGSDTTNLDGVTAAALGAWFEQLMDSDPLPVQPMTGLGWLDMLCEGWTNKHLWVISGAYGSGKTRLALNLIIQAAKHGQSVGFLSYEMSYEEVAANIIAMLASAWLIKTGHFEEHYSSMGKAYPVNWISATSLLKARNGYKKWTPIKVQAIAYAIRTFKTLNLRIYDSSADYGGLRSFDDGLRIIQFDRRVHKGALFFVDHFQLIEASGTIFEQSRYMANGLQHITRRDDITLVVLSQLNEDSIKNPSSHSPGLKGGGDLAAAADWVLLVNPTKGEAVDSVYKLALELRKARHGHSKQKTTQDAHVNSGLLLDMDFITRLEV